MAFDPEVVFYVDYLAGEDGWARTMQVHPDGSADVISHRPSQLDHGVRWISRTPDQDALGMCLPATAEPEGYHVEKAKGNVARAARPELGAFRYGGRLSIGRRGEPDGRRDRRDTQERGVNNG